jgi:putative transposase
MPSTYSNLLFHIVFSTKQRIPVITNAIQTELYNYIGGIIRGEGGVVLEIGGVADHVHLLIKLKPVVSVSEMLKHIKASSSKWLNETHANFGKFYWQEGYAAFSVSESQVDVVAKYIQNQETHHRQQTFQEELLTLLKKHNIDYDKRYLWD